MPRKRLTEEGVRKLRPTPGKQVDYFDQGLLGLVLRVSPGGTKAFNAIHYVDQKAKHFRIGRYDPKGAEAVPESGSGQPWPRDLTLKGARDAARKFFGNPRLYLEPPTAPVEKATFKAVCERYLAGPAAKFRSRKEIERVLNKHAYPLWEAKAFVEVTRSDVTGLRANVLTNNGPSQADSVFGIIRTIMNWFEAEGDVEGYVCPIRARTRKIVSGGSGRERVLCDDEIRLIWRAAEEPGQIGALIRLLLLTAQRREKVAKMKWEDLDGDVWTIPREPREKSNAGVLKLPPLAMKILAEIPKIEGNPHVFPGRYGDKPINSFSQMIAEFRAKLPADMPRWTIHDLRRTARTALANLDVSDRIAEQVLGHAIQGVEKVYNRSRYFEAKADALLRLAGYIERLVHNADGNVVHLPLAPQLHVLIERGQAYQA